MNEMKIKCQVINLTLEKQGPSLPQSQPTAIEIDYMRKPYITGRFTKRSINTSFPLNCRVQTDTVRTGGFQAK